MSWNFLWAINRMNTSRWPLPNFGIHIWPPTRLYRRQAWLQNGPYPLLPCPYHYHHHQRDQINIFRCSSSPFCLWESQAVSSHTSQSIARSAPRQRSDTLVQSQKSKSRSGWLGSTAPVAVLRGRSWCGWAIKPMERHQWCRHQKSLNDPFQVGQYGECQEKLPNLTQVNQ